MHIPVLIAARNEENFLPRTLDSLPTNVEPIVVTNGCTDQTIDVAHSAGVTVLENDIEGKLPAIQTGLRYLGERALDPLLILDSDTRPLSNQWANVMHKSVASHNDLPRIAGGLVFFSDHIDPVSSIVYSIKPVFDARKVGASHIRGANMALSFRNKRLLDQVLAMPNYWPGEEAAIVDAFLEAKGEIMQVWNPLAVVLTDGARLTSIAARFLRGANFTHNHFVDSYKKDAPSNAISYWELDH